MAAPLLPQAFWFRLAVPCRRIEGLPRSGKRLLDLPESCRVPQTALLDGREPWAEVRVAWNPQGLAVAVEAEGNLTRLANVDQLEGQFGFQVWVDTRDTRNVSRATRFCHRFDARLKSGPTKSSLAVVVQPRPIARAVSDAPLCDPSIILAQAEKLKGAWRVELFLPATALSGFDPDTNRRLGFCYQISDPDRPVETLGVAREFPVGENPSLWSTLELEEMG